MAWLTAVEAMATLGVKPQTLYAYVSRNRVKAKPDPKDSRRSLYDAEDVRRLTRQRTPGARRAAVAESSIAWGEPVLPSAISTVVEGKLIYRGEDACALAARATLEDVAILLWNAGTPDFSAREKGTSPKDGDARRAAFAFLAARAAIDQPVYGRAATVLARDAAALMAGMAQVFTGRTAGKAPIHARLAAHWRLGDKAADALRVALVLLADHELNASTFAARVAASTGASLSACALAGLSALSGPLHGGAAAALDALLQDAARNSAERAVRQWLDLGRAIPGFGHALYPLGDPRATLLLARVAPTAPFVALRDAVERLIGEPPNIDFALAAFVARHRLPADAPFVIFAQARLAGWLAHAIEQATTGKLIRPRARYIGRMPALAP
ncbi:MAG TPA: citrate/2-methylcitrate synthase [Dongiaceae bacterium]|nr:citrate/2-methylcitrate synthase [Dongiaceae bacterium]